jgi:hypothetical protein
MGTCADCGEEFDGNDPEIIDQCPDCFGIAFGGIDDGSADCESEEEEEEEEEDYSTNAEPEEGDICTDDHINFYQYGKLVLSIEDDAEWAHVVNAFCEQEKFWPNVWWISDHGNAHLLSMYAELAAIDEV